MATGGTATGLTTAATDTRTSPEEPWSVAGEVYRSRVWQDLRSLFQQDELTDVMLAADGQSIPCHRVLLAAASKFFHDKFVTHPESLDHNLLDVEDVDFVTLRSIVSFIYSGQLALTLEKAEKLLPASVNLQLPELTNMCKDFLLHQVDNDTSACIVIHRVAKANTLKDIEDQAWQVMLKKFQHVAVTDSFKEMAETEVQQYISDNRLNVSNEDPVFEALVIWVKHDLENRKSMFGSLVENIKLSNCSPSFLKNTVRKEPLMTSVDCLKLLADALLCYTSSHPHQDGTPRHGYSGDNTLIAVYEDQCLTLRDDESEWTCQDSFNGKRLEDSSACIMGDGIMVTGGCGNGRNCWKLTLPTLNWTALPDLNEEHRDHATVCVGNQIYVLGGWNGNKSISTVEYLGHETGSWHVAGDMPYEVDEHTAVNYKQCIYVFGGRSSQTTFMLDTVTKKWSKKADMPESCRGGSSVVYRDRIYVLGGDENCCMSYDPDQDQWKTHSKPAERHYLTSAVLWKDRILLCGGWNTSTEKVIEEYNADTDMWSECKHQLPKATAAAVFADMWSECKHQLAAAVFAVRM